MESNINTTYSCDNTPVVPISSPYHLQTPTNVGAILKFSNSQNQEVVIPLIEDTAEQVQSSSDFSNTVEMNSELESLSIGANNTIETEEVSNNVEILSTTGDFSVLYDPSIVTFPTPKAEQYFKESVKYLVDLLETNSEFLSEVKSPEKYFLPTNMQAYSEYFNWLITTAGSEAEPIEDLDWPTLIKENPEWVDSYWVEETMVDGEKVEIVHRRSHFALGFEVTRRKDAPISSLEEQSFDFALMALRIAGGRHGEVILDNIADKLETDWIKFDSKEAFVSFFKELGYNPEWKEPETTLVGASL